MFALHELDCGCRNVEPLYGNSWFHAETGETLMVLMGFLKGQLQPSATSSCLSPHLANPLIVKV